MEVHRLVGARVTPNRSFNRTRYGKRRKAGPRYFVLLSQPGLTPPAYTPRLTLR